MYRIFSLERMEVYNGEINTNILGLLLLGVPSKAIKLLSYRNRATVIKKRDSKRESKPIEYSIPVAPET